ncbi:hypothetical protein B566_EDAN008877 [Ephemera danica]|nr:hypothetical protein B566_EDAN008877 [Ephemera danica]
MKFRLLYVKGAPKFHVALRAPRFVDLGGSAMLYCEHSVTRDQLHKVEWLRDGRKIFQYVRGRSPPYRNFSTPGADLDWTHTNDRQVMLRNLRFNASGSYSCEVSTDTPIYTKPSNDEPLTVILKQRADPQISGRKPGLYSPGERLELNCTSSPSHPEADITWFINGHKVDDGLVRAFANPNMLHGHGNHDLISTTVQLTLELSEEHALMVAGPGGHQLLPPSASAPFHPGHSTTGLTSGQLHVTCLSTIPEFQGLEAEENHLQPSAFRYADRRVASHILIKMRGINPLGVEVVAPLPSPDPAASAKQDHSSSDTATGISTAPLLLHLIILVMLSSISIR